MTKHKELALYKKALIELVPLIALLFSVVVLIKAFCQPEEVRSGKRITNETWEEFKEQNPELFNKK